MKDETLNSYEMMLILAPDLGETGEATALAFVRDLIDSNGGNIYHEDIWGIRDLAYTIKKYDRGFYAVLNFHFAGTKLGIFDQPMSLNKDIMRYMIIKTEADYEIKTLEDYKEEARLEKEEQDRIEAEKEAKKIQPKKTVAKKVAPKKEEAPKAEKTEVEAPKKEVKKKSEVDEKLKSIIEDPNISL